MSRTHGMFGQSSCRRGIISTILSRKMLIASKTFATVIFAPKNSVYPAYLGYLALVGCLTGVGIHLIEASEGAENTDLFILLGCIYVVSELRLLVKS